MSEIKITKSRRTRKTSEQDAYRMRVAAAVVELLTNPETPARLYSSVSDDTSEWSNAYLNATQYNPTEVKRHLDYYCAEEATQIDVETVDEVTTTVDKSVDLNMWRQSRPRPIKTTAVQVD